MKFKTVVQDIFKDFKLGEKYLRLNKNVWAVVANDAFEKRHLIMRYKEMIEETGNQELTGGNTED